MSQAQSPVTPELLKEAIASAHDSCKDGCIHGEALASKADDIVTIAALGVVETGINPTLGLLSEAFHIGYRAAELVHQAATKIPLSEVN